MRARCRFLAGHDTPLIAAKCSGENGLEFLRYPPWICRKAVEGHRTPKGGAGNAQTRPGSLGTRTGFGDLIGDATFDALTQCQINGVGDFVQHPSCVVVPACAHVPARQMG
jgi:hypothetical protein